MTSSYFRLNEADQYSTAVAALISLFSLFTAIWGLHLRLSKAQEDWKKEAVMVRRRSMAFSASGIPHDGMGNRLSVSMPADSSTAVGSEAEKRWSSQSNNVVNYYSGAGVEPGVVRRSSVMKDQMSLSDEEERLESDLEVARRNSREHATLQRAS